MSRLKGSAEYSTQLLELPPSAIIEIILGTIESAVPDIIESMHGSMLSTLGDIPKEDIEAGTKAMKAKFSDKMPNISSRLENYFQECIFKIPDHVLLPEDSVQRNKCTSKNEKNVLKEIESLKVAYQNALYQREVLTGKHQEAKESLAKHKATKGELEAMLKAFEENHLRDPVESAEFIRKNYQQFQLQLQQLISMPISTNGLDSNENQTSSDKLAKYLV